MKISEKWLREWVNPKLKREALCDALTMAGFEVEEDSPAAPEFTHVVVGEVQSVGKHPEADRLQVCEVDVGRDKPLTIVCAAENVREGMKYPVALVKAHLPNDITVKEAAIRGVTSHGMLCSAADLDLSEDNSGLYTLDAKAKPGTDLRKYMGLDDHVIVVAVQPDRGDCLSIRGMTREISAITKTPFKDMKIKPVKPANRKVLDIKLAHKKGCPHYVGRVIRDVKANVPTPMWLKERLRRCGVRSISPIVDVTNYVMFELGQPMHAFDLDKIDVGIQVRNARAGEEITLLDGCVKRLTPQTMVIADRSQPLAIAGVMGGQESGVSEWTTHIFLESAYFCPEVIAQQRQYYNLNSDSSYRFERGVDPTLQKTAIERATRLILDICGGTPGPVSEKTVAASMPRKKTVTLPDYKVEQVLGIKVPDKTITAIFKSLQFGVKHTARKWHVQVPLFRFDISLPEDLIEEIARLYGLDKIPPCLLHGELQLPQEIYQDNGYQALREALSGLGYHEIVTYSFVDKNLQSLLDPGQEQQELINPITADMTVMRTNLWPGLINTFLYNRARQQSRVRLFEIGTCFITQNQQLNQVQRLAGLISGTNFPEGWGHKNRQVDFFDLKGDLEALLKPYVNNAELVYNKARQSVLHPGQSAVISNNTKEIGVIGALNPNVLHALDIPGPVFVFEIDLPSLGSAKTQAISEISRFPEIRRDIAILVNEAVPSKDIQATIRKIAGDWLKDVFIFDVYHGEGISPGRKSIALGLVIQHPTRTLVDDEVTELMQRVVTTLKGQLGAELRS